VYVRFRIRFGMHPAGDSHAQTQSTYSALFFSHMVDTKRRRDGAPGKRRFCGIWRELFLAMSPDRAVLPDDTR
jgi:hypothetical protein